MTDEQAERVLEVALRDRESMALRMAELILQSDIREFIPEAAKAAFLEWERHSEMMSLLG
jgi:hypothetical protein